MDLSNGDQQIHEDIIQQEEPQPSQQRPRDGRRARDDIIQIEEKMTPTEDETALTQIPRHDIRRDRVITHHVQLLPHRRTHQQESMFIIIIIRSRRHAIPRMTQ